MKNDRDYLLGTFLLTRGEQSCELRSSSKPPSFLTGGQLEATHAKSQLAKAKHASKEASEHLPRRGPRYEEGALSGRRECAFF